MLIQRVNRTDAEKIFLICQNGEGTTISTGMGARFLGGLAAEVVSTDGVQVIKLDSNLTMTQFAGIADQDIKSLGYGRIQAWGYVNSVLYSALADATIAIIARAASYLQKGGLAGTWFSGILPENLSTMGYKYVQAMTTVNVSGGLNYGKGFVRAL